MSRRYRQKSIGRVRVHNGDEVLLVVSGSQAQADLRLS